MRCQTGTEPILAVERAAMVKERTGEIPGLESSHEQINGISITRVQVTNPYAASQVGKPPGRYFTLECPELKYRNRTLLKNVAQIIAKELAVLAELPGAMMCLWLDWGTGRRPLTPLDPG